MAAKKRTGTTARARGITLDVKGERVPRSWSVPECHAPVPAVLDAAEEPKTLTWYEGGHWPAAPVIDADAEWVAERLRVVRAPRIRSAGRAG